jgi:hypothetical protein
VVVDDTVPALLTSAFVCSFNGNKLNPLPASPPPSLTPPPGASNGQLQCQLFIYLFNQKREGVERG